MIGLNGLDYIGLKCTLLELGLSLTYYIYVYILLLVTIHSEII